MSNKNKNIQKQKMKKIEKLLELIKKTEKDKKVKKIVSSRIKKFEKIRNGTTNDIFKELCFCILTANFNAEKSIQIQNKIGNGFLTLPESTLAKRLKELAHRFPNTRARYIVKARKYKEEIREKILSVSNKKNKEEIREWLVRNIKGIGYKEASHFLRNIGFKEFAIIDFHIIDLLKRFNLIKKTKNIGKKRYLEIEKTLKALAKKLRITLAELDFYLWYIETKKILK